MLYLIATLLCVAAGPLFASLARRARATTIALDAFVLVVLGGLVLLHILPHAVEGAGLLALIAAAGAFMLASFAERGLHRHHHERRTDHDGHAGFAPRLIVGLALLGLFVHQLVDGVALAGADAAHDAVHGVGEAHEHGRVWAIAVLLHTLPKSIALWWIVAPLLGLRAAIVMLALMVVGTLLGFSIGEPLLSTATPASIALFEALFAGTLMHVVMHADLPAPPAGTRQLEVRAASLVGLVAGIAAVAWIEGGHAHSHAGAGGDDAFATFVHLAGESAPALLFAWFAVGLAQAFLPAQLGWLAQRGSTFAQALRGVLVGIPLPVCSCGVVPMYRDLVRRGASIAGGIAFLVATPELELAALLLTWQFFGGEFAAARLVAAAALALLTALIVARVAPRAPASVPSLTTQDDRPHGLAARLRTVLRAGYRESVDETAPWIVVGLGLGALLTPLLDPQSLAGLPSTVAVPLAALIGMPLYVCASGSTPLAAVLVMKGLSPGAALAFLLTGPATNVTTFGVLSRSFDRRTAIVFAVVMFLGASGLGLLVDALLAPRGAVTASDAHDHASTIESIALWVLGAIVLASVLRQGVRRFLGQLFDTPTLAELTASPAASSSPAACCPHDHEHEPERANYDSRRS
ncbi:MAG: permease [Planctomycetes bacterium]|nr:permease [Planctomycetota bacterium]